jgi:hypothetical protein
MLQIAEQLLAFETDFPNRKNFSGCRLMVGWNCGNRTIDTLNETMRGPDNLLPDPEGSYTQAFELQFIPKQPADAAAAYDRLGDAGYRAKYDCRGSSEFRVHAVSREGQEALQLYANIGRMEGLKSILKEVLDPIEFPILVRDQYGGRFENATWQALEPAADR